MMKSDVVTLIGLSPAAHEVGTEPQESRHDVFCTVRSIGMQEAYQAMGQGLNPEIKVILPHDFEYAGEPECELGGVRYRILRTYITEADGIELTLQRVTGNAAEVT
jgi:SPP1 family predicted phage head-tail adaptor